MTALNGTLTASFSPRPQPYPAFRLYLREIRKWLEQGYSVRSVWLAWKEKGAFPGCYRTFLRYCRKHRLLCSRAFAPEAPPREQSHFETEHEDPLASRPRHALTSKAPVSSPRVAPKAPTGSRPPVVQSANSARPSKIYPAPVSPPREFIPSKEDYDT